MIAKRHADDMTVQRFMDSDGLHIAWESRASGELYGGVAQGSDVDRILIEEGLDPDAFWREVGRL